MIFLIILHLFITGALIAAILMQKGEAAGIGSSSGQGLFTAKGSANLMIMTTITTEHELFIQKYKESYALVLNLMRNILYLDQKAFAFERLNQFMLQSHHSHIPFESHLLMAFLLSKP